MAPPSEIYIESTETDPAVHARHALRRIHQRLREGAGPDELRGYLEACDRTLYGAASGAAETRLLVRALRTSASALHRRLDASGDGDAPAPEALLDAHLLMEEEVLLPALLALPGADLPLLVADLEGLLKGEEPESPAVVDVREIPHGRRHPRIFARFARLAPGESFTLVNNHDPRPLRREFEATHPDAFTWEYVESGPEQWRILIGRKAAAGA
ncbi:DUF2249 domain-containing protein [Streptomyces naganishii]|uniref:DUF2249 domain-containing protein n=1 Tax=Streptomyces naganishii JCM 4654 TaxID=1306179 RepID=A0A918Y0Q0_9ACTN|nr:DUF2249 domain-containing protein [Streptomyces naganishii]GHD85467.1 hypothetical protein GCM10010508_09350 [Streptomyces naganishii JCM 4654]